MKLRWLVIATIMIIMAYPIVELTRCIVEYNILTMLAAQKAGAGVMFTTGIWSDLAPGWSPTLNDLYVEIGMMWSLYLAVPVLLWKAFNRVAFDAGSKVSREAKRKNEDRPFRQTI